MDILVVGGGLIGLLTARELALTGATVQILERGTSGRESSWAGGGILSPLNPWRYPDAVTELSRWSQMAYPALAEELSRSSGVDPQWTQSGMLMLGLADEERFQALQWAIRFGFDMEVVDGEATRRIEPALGPTLGGGVWMPKVAQMRNPRLLQAMKQALRPLGVDIVEDCRVGSLRLENGRVKGVETTQGTFGARQVVVAGGAWSGELLPGLPVEPVRGQMLLFKGEPGLLGRIVLEEGHYVIPRRDGRVLVGSTFEQVGFDKATTDGAREELSKVAIRLVPGLEALEIEAHWAGLRPGSPEGIPYIGPHPELEGLFVNTGHFRNGVVMGLASARLLSDLISGNEPIVDPLPYRPRLAHNS